MEIVYGSLLEVVSHLKISERQGFIEKGSMDELVASADQLARMLSGFKKSRQGR
jgi:four helix bundle protein